MFAVSGVYVLKLENDKFYVGSSDNIAHRYVSHQEGRGSAWTRKFPPISIHAVFPSSTPHSLLLLEEDVTYDMMTKFGIANVRGASFTQMEVPPEEHEAIAKLLLHRQNKCIKCGEEGHYINTCPNVQPKEMSGFWGWVQKGVKVAQEAAKNESNSRCFRCGREGHFVSACYAKTNTQGRIL